MRNELTRGQTAKKPGVSVARVRQLQQDDWTLQSRVDRRGWHMFDADDVEALRRKRACARGEDPQEGVPERESRVLCDDCGQESMFFVEPLTERLAPAGACLECWSARRRERRRRGFGSRGR